MERDTGASIACACAVGDEMMRAFSACIFALTVCAAHAAIERPQCISGAKAGGGFDLTCKLAQAGLQVENLLPETMGISYVPGGIGAVAFNAIVTHRRAESSSLVAFSSGSLLNLAQGKFGAHDERDVR